MLWRLWLSVLLGMASIAGFVGLNHCLRAAEPPERVETDIGNSLMVRWRAVQFHMMLGRLELDPPQHRNGSKTEEYFEPTPIRESFTVTANRGIPSLHYTCRTPTREIVLDIVDADRVELQSELLMADEYLRLTQPSRGPLLLHHRTAEADRVFKSPSWLHLQSTHPALFDQHLEPLLESVLPDLSLQQLREEATESLLVLARVTRPPSQEELRGLVEQLNDRRRRERDHAQGKLVDYGVLVIPFLDNLPSRDLHQEQQLRIEAIRRQLRPRQPDHASGVARWLIADSEYWNAIAYDLSSEQKLVANQHLQRMYGEGLTAMADGPTRVAQSSESSNRR